MIANNGKRLRIARVLSLGLSLFLLLTVGVANGYDSANNDSSVGEDTTVAKVIGDQATASSMEPRSEEEGSTSTWTWTRSVGSASLSRNRDSYLEALKHSRTSTDPREGIVAVDGSSRRRKEESQGPVYAAKRIAHPDPDRFSMVPSDSYSLPTRTSVDFASSGGNTYGPPRGSYGPPSNDYSSYGDYAHSPPQQAYGPAVPYGHGGIESVQLGFPSIDFSWPFALKLNAFTLAKILLKLVIFKMIVKFIAVICLLLFVPKLEIKKSKKGNNAQNNHDDDDDDDEGRSLLDANSRVWDRLNRLTVAVYDALKQHGVHSDGDCSTLGCRIRGALEVERSWPDYQQLLQSYLLEETRAKS